jgi:hypothetical protein
MFAHGKRQIAEVWINEGFVQARTPTGVELI